MISQDVRSPVVRMASPGVLTRARGGWDRELARRSRKVDCHGSLIGAGDPGLVVPAGQILMAGIRLGLWEMMAQTDAMRHPFGKK